MQIRPDEWHRLKRLAGRTFSSSLHFSIATTNADGSPHVTPIGSLILMQPGEACYFEIFTSALRENLERGSDVCVLGVVSSRPLWLSSLARGRFATPPAFRLSGSAGPRRPSTPEERRRFERRVRWLRRLRGYDMLWGDLSFVRELRITSLEPVVLGRLTAGLWNPEEEDR